MKRTLGHKLLRFHWMLLLLMLALCIGGVFFIYSATHLSDIPGLKNAARQQIMWMGIGLVLFIGLSLTHYRYFIHNGLAIFAVSLILLGAVLIVGTEVKGAKSWFRFGSIGFQPAEVAKVAFVCGYAWLIVLFREHIKKFWVLIVLGLVSAIPVGLILLQTDFGSASVFAPITYIMLMAAGIRKRWLLIPVLGVVLVGLVCYVYVYKMGNDIPVLKTYQNNRIKSFYEPELDPLGAGWTIRQSLIAVGSGGWKGKGYLKGEQNIYGFLPKDIAYNDFVFSVVAEEFGFIGGSLLIAAFGLLLLSVLQIGIRAKDYGGSLLCAGIGGMFFAHFFVNVGMTIKVVPITGIPLPLVSYGGSFLMTCMIGLGILQSVWIHRRDY